jgi:hypothetical protein
VWVAQRIQKLGKRGAVGVGHLQAHQNAAVVSALVAVVEQTDVPAFAHGQQKLHQRAGPLGELKAQQAFVVGQAGVAADQMAQVLFGIYLFQLNLQMFYTSKKKKIFTI